MATRRAIAGTLTVVLWCVHPLAGAAALTPGAPAASAASAASAAPPKTVTDAVTHISASEDLQRATQARLQHAARIQELERRSMALQQAFEGLAAGVATTTELIDAVTLARQLHTLRADLTIVADELESIARHLERDRAVLDADARTWREHLSLLDDQRLPARIVERAQSTEARLQGLSERVKAQHDIALLALDGTVGLLSRIDDARARIASQEELIRAQRLQVERSSFRQLLALPSHFDLIDDELRTAWRLLASYLSREGSALAGLFLGVLALSGWLFKRAARRGAGAAQRAYGQPWTASLLMALMAVWWLARDPPTLFYEALLVLLPMPAAILLRSALPAPMPLTLYGIALATMLIPIRGVVEASAIAGRLLLLVQALSLAVPVAADLRHGRLQAALGWVKPGAVRAGAMLVLAGAAVTLLHVIFGFTRPAGSLRAGMGSVLGFGLVFGAAALALYGAVLGLLATPALHWLRSARDADPALLRVARIAIGAFAVVGVTIATLGVYGLVPTLLLAGQSLMNSTLEVGTLSIGIDAIATALMVAIGTFALVGITDFTLDREILPRLQLRPGAGYAVATFTRWALMLIGGALTLAALGIDMGRLTLLAGALSVGIGFGLQNVVNNFVSGLILIVERPVGVGDLIEMGSLSGTVTRIGIRSSTVRTGQGAEVIVPNGELVSKDVVNWTRSDRQRRYDIDVGVAPGSDPERVMRLLVEAAADVPQILQNPPPRAKFKGIGDSSLDFTLMAWVPTVDVGLQAQNELRIAILRKLEGAGIAIPFPQRDLHVQSADDRARSVAG